MRSSTLVLFCSKKQIGISLQTRTIHVQVSFVLQYQTTLRKIELYEVKVPFCFSDYLLALNFAASYFFPNRTFLGNVVIISLLILEAGLKAGHCDLLSTKF